ncbi:MAG: signal recognition particle protein [Gammaproteobacteria bacterium]|nr:signal recognition particle protein [Gammaproteobacteria bacterium]
MFDNLTQRLDQALRNLRGIGRLTEDNIKDTLRNVRLALLEADVALPVVKALLEQVRVRAVGTEVLKSLTPGQVFIKIVNDELTQLMGASNDELLLTVTPPAVILMAGLQGAGKTTTAGKLAYFLKTRQRKQVMVVSCDVYRPAAIAQLKTVAEQAGASFFPSETNQLPAAIAEAALKAARIQHADVLIVDTAGRLHIDSDMMQEIQQLHEQLQPVETLFVVDSMTGQDAANTAAAFAKALPLTGVILTKADGDARGGAALSVRYLTGKPIKFMGTGEKLEALEPFYPERVSARILGMGDVVGLVEAAQQHVDQAQAQKLAQKVKKGGFDLEDFREQFRQLQNMGGISSLLDKLPGMGQLPAGAASAIDDRQVKRMEAIINAMTPKERRKPDILNGSRKRRIAAGSGTQVQDVNRLLKQFDQIQRMMKQMRKGGGIQRLMQQFKGRMPPGIG